MVALAYFGATEIVDHYTQFSFCAGVFPDIVTKHTAYNCKKIEKILNKTSLTDGRLSVLEYQMNDECDRKIWQKKTATRFMKGK